MNALPEEPTSSRYVEHARAINTIAGEALNLKSRKVENLRAKISIGLSLQAVELAGKAMLRALGISTADILEEYKHHDLLTLFAGVEREMNARADPRLSSFKHFLLRTTVIDGQPFSSTTKAYFEKHCAQGPFAKPRNYLYPDFPKWTGPVPIHAVYYMVEDIIEVADAMIHELSTD